MKGKAIKSFLKGTALIRVGDVFDADEDYLKALQRNGLVAIQKAASGKLELDKEKDEPAYTGPEPEEQAVTAPPENQGKGKKK